MTDPERDRALLEEAKRRGYDPAADSIGSIAGESGISDNPDDRRQAAQLIAEALEDVKVAAPA